MSTTNSHSKNESTPPCGVPLRTDLVKREEPIEEVIILFSSIFIIILLILGSMPTLTRASNIAHGKTLYPLYLEIQQENIL